MADDAVLCASAPPRRSGLLQERWEGVWGGGSGGGLAEARAASGEDESQAHGQARGRGECSAWPRPTRPRLSPAPHADISARHASALVVVRMSHVGGANTLHFAKLRLAAVTSLSDCRRCKFTCYTGERHTRHNKARVRHAWDARLEAGRVQRMASVRVGERAARSLDRVSRRRGPRRAAGASLEQRDLLDDVRRVREHSRGNDAARWWER